MKAGGSWASANFEVGGGKERNRERREEGEQQEDCRRDEIYYEKYMRQVKSSASLKIKGTCRICGCHSGSYECCHILGCSVVRM
jgi:hypothetical protein